MLHTIKNDFLTVSAVDKGAELHSVTAAGIEFLWNGNPDFWGGRSPILFPVVGRLNGGKYKYEGTTYELPGHGFGRAMDFTLSENTENSLEFELCSSEATLAVYPFEFKLYIRYTIESNALITAYKVENAGDKDMLFSIGGHPAFNCPIAGENESFEDYYLEFNKGEAAGIHLVKEGGLVTDSTVPFFENGKIINLNHKLFENDALVFSSLNSDIISIKSKKRGKCVQMEFKGFPFFGIWTKPGAPYICLEPWYGVADTPGFSGELQDKKGIQCIQARECFDCNYTVKFFV